MSWETGAVLGFIHLLLHVGFILVVPIFLITAALLACWEKTSAGRAADHVEALKQKAQTVEA